MHIKCHLKYILLSPRPPCIVILVSVPTHLNSTDQPVTTHRRVQVGNVFVLQWVTELHTLKIA